MSSIDLLYMVCCLLRDLYRIRHRNAARQQAGLLRITQTQRSPTRPGHRLKQASPRCAANSNTKYGRKLQREILELEDGLDQERSYTDDEDLGRCLRCSSPGRMGGDNLRNSQQLTMDTICSSRNATYKISGSSKLVSNSTMQSEDSRSDLLNPGAISHFRARSPSPFESPAHQHLTLDGLRISNLQNNNADKEPGGAASLPSDPLLSVPTKCSSQLAKVLEKQIESSTIPDSAAPSLAFSPYSSPSSSPRVKRRPLKMTKQASTEQLGNYLQLNQYKLMGMVGQGSYSIVKLAYNVDEDTHYAMKILSKKKLQKKAGIFGRIAPTRKGPGGRLIKKAENPLDKVYREIAILKKLDHPNVVKLVEVVDDPEEDNLYMAFEFLEKGELLEIPTDKPLSEEESWRSFRDVISGLEYLHYQKIIHRDIKPSNLLRADNGEVKIADLGVSNEFDGPDAFLTNTAGTPAFTAPECLSIKQGDSPYSGKAADIWSLGVTLYCLVFGCLPWPDDNIVVIYNKIRTQPLQIPSSASHLSPELLDLLRKMLVKDPAERIKLEEIKVDPWVTGYGLYPMMRRESNCGLIEVTEDEVENSVKSIPKLDTLILVKAMIKKHSFANPFPSFRQKFGKNGRSNSAPGAFDVINDSVCSKAEAALKLPSLSEDSTEESQTQELL